MRLPLIAALAALISLSPSLAHATASQASGFSWTGMFVGVNAGYGRGNSDWDLSAAGSGSNSHTVDGGLVGLQAGFNMQLASGLVAGVEVSTEATNVGGKSGCAGGSCKTTIGSLSDVSGRLGVNWNTALLFGKAGVAYQKNEHYINGASDKTGSMGYVAGAGIELYIDNNITSNIEYNYYRFNEDSASVGATHIDDTTSISVVKAGFNLKFN